MIPLRDYNPVSKPSVVVPALIAINIVVFLFVQPTFATGSQRDRAVRQVEFFACKAAIPYEIIHGTDLSRADPGALDQGGRVFARFQQRACPDKSVAMSIAFSMFLHAGFLHIAGNMLFLFVFGNNVEDKLGRIRFVLFYLLCGLAATYAQALVNPQSTGPMIGASGAVAGVLGAYLVMFPRARVRTAFFFFFITVFDVPAVIVLGVWFVLQFFQGVASVSGGAGGVAYMAHVGGFVAGMLLLALFRPRHGARDRYAG